MERRRKTMKRSHPIRITIITIIGVFLALLILISVANYPKHQARSHAISVAKKYSGLKNPGAFYTYNRETTYYAIAGKNKKNQKIFVIVPKKGHNVKVLKQSSGIYKNEALTQIWNKRNPKKVLKISLGIFNGSPVWEVTYTNQHNKLCYELLNFKDGKDLQKITNI